MIVRKLREIHRNQKGFNMVELTLAILLTGIISTGITASIFQMIQANDSITNRKTAITDVESAIFWISSDAQVAQTFDTDPTPDFLKMSWVEWDNTVHEVTYTIIGSEMQRQYSVDGGASQDFTIAYFIDPDETSWDFTDNFLNFTITSTVGDFRPATESRVGKILPRAMLR